MKKDSSRPSKQPTNKLIHPHNYNKPNQAKSSTEENQINFQEQIRKKINQSTIHKYSKKR